MRRTAGLFIFFFFLIFGLSRRASAQWGFSPPFWQPMDVAVLLPLHAAWESSTHGPLGTLLPFERVRDLLTRIEYHAAAVQKAQHEESRMVGLRIDPRQRQVRMVWQAVIRDDSDKLTTRDRNFHSFYALGAKAFRAMLGELRQLKRWQLNLSPPIQTLGRPMGVHPAALHPAFANFNEALKRIILRYCGERNLVQLTTSQDFTANIWWKFAGIERDASGKWASIRIPRTHSVSIDFFNHGGPEGQPGGFGMKGATVPFDIPGDPAFFDALKEWHPLSPEDRPIVRSALQSLHRFENPRKETDKTLDCVSCHVTASARAYWTANASRINGLPQDVLKDAFQNPSPLYYNASNASAATRSTKVLRAFGYFGSEPAFNQRLIFEAIDGASALNQGLY